MSESGRLASIKVLERLGRDLGELTVEIRLLREDLRTARRRHDQIG